jgi:hypothetical protein
MPTSLRNSQLASIFYGAQASWQPMTMIPKYRYMFYANFQLNGNAPQMDQTFLKNLGSSSPGNISFKIKTIDKPKIDLTTVELNQYNRKRLIYTKTEYLPFTIKIHDSVDGSAIQFWKDYFTYYFGDSRPKSASAYQYSTSGPTIPVLDNPNGWNWGLSAIAEDTNFFTRLDLYSLFGGNLVGTAGGTGEYQLTSYITFKYEAIQYNPIQKGVSSLFQFSADGNAFDVQPGVNTTFIPSPGPNTTQQNNFYNPLNITPTIVSQGLNSIIASAVNNPVTGASPGYANTVVDSSTTNSDLTNSTSFIYTAVSANAGLLDFGT